MKNITILTVATIIAGCATTSQIDEANARVQELEKRLARIEGDLYKVEEKSAPKQEKKAEPKFVPAKEVEQSVIDTKINAFLSEYLGVAFGDSIDKYPNAIEGRDYLYDRYRIITVRKKFQYFDKALAHFEEGKLYAVSFFADIDDKYSIDSTNERIDQTRADLAVTFGLASDAFKNAREYRLRRRIGLLNRGASGDDSSFAMSSYVLENCSSELAPRGFRRYGVEIRDGNLRNRLRAEKEAKDRAKGEQLPEAK